MNDQRLVHTYSGKKLDLDNVRADDININDIARGLGMLCRFSGQVSQFYSVAEHSIILSFIVKSELAKVALMHDAAEAYINDLLKPVKDGMNEYTSIEKSVLNVIFDKYGLDISLLPEVIKIEVRDLLPAEVEFLQPYSDWECLKDKYVRSLMLINTFSPPLSIIQFGARFDALFPNQHTGTWL